MMMIDNDDLHVPNPKIRCVTFPLHLPVPNDADLHTPAIGSWDQIGLIHCHHSLMMLTPLMSGWQRIPSFQGISTGFHWSVHTPALVAVLYCLSSKVHTSAEIKSCFPEVTWRLNSVQHCITWFQLFIGRFLVNLSSSPRGLSTMCC